MAATPNVKVLTGDINGDRRTEIALTGVASWAGVPVAFSNGNGTWRVTNVHFAFQHDLSSDVQFLD